MNDSSSAVGAPPAPSGAGILVLVTRDGMGHAEDAALRQKLLRTFLTLLDQNGMLPGAIAFYTDGVRLAVEGSPVLDALKTLESKGVRLILCSTCLNAFGLADKVRVGVVGGMGDIVAAMWKAQKVVTI